MCGIAGYCLNSKEHNSNQTGLTAQMLLDIEHRGQHATGAAWINAATGNRVISKAAMSASKFIKTKTGRRACLDATTAILHTRFATKGTPQVNQNNHPIPRGKIVLTHNGHVNNDRELFKELKVKRHAQVDSEAIAALIAFGDAPIVELLPRLQGTAALAWIEQGRSNTLHLARVNSSPLWIGQTRTGSLVYGSTRETILNAAVMLDTSLDWEHSADEGEYFKVRNGKILDYLKFTPHRTPAIKYNWRKYSPLYTETGDMWQQWDNGEWDSKTEHSGYYDTHLF